MRLRGNRGLGDKYDRSTFQGPHYKYLTAFLKIKRPASKWG